MSGPVAPCLSASARNCAASSRVFIEMPADGSRSPSTQLVKIASTVSPCSEIDKSSTHLSAVCARDPARAQRQLRRFMASKTKVTPQKEEMLEKEGAFVNLKTKKRLRPLLG